MSSPWLTTAEAVALLGYKSRQALYHLRRKGVFKAGVHFTQPAGMSTRWNRAALERHLWGRRGAAPPRAPRRRAKLAPHLMPGG